MFNLAQVLDVTVSFFCDDMPEGAADPDAVGKSEDVAGNKDPLVWRESLQLLRPYHKIAAHRFVNGSYEW